MLNKFITTEDGSITCLEPECGELYHNRAGAYTEALNNYAKPCALEKRVKKQKQIAVLDSCFGLGYNTFVFINELLEQLNTNNLGGVLETCRIVAIDRDRDIVKLLPEILAQSQFKLLCQTLDSNQMLDTLQNSAIYSFNPKADSSFSISLELKFADLRRAVLRLVENEEQFDCIFHDGFSPRAMPELWTIDLFQLYKKLLNSDGRIITYSSAYAIRSALKQCGLQIRKTIAVGKKSGGTIAFKNSEEIVDNENIFFLSQEENEKLSSHSGIPYRDPDFKYSRAQIVENREAEIRQAKLCANK